MRDFETAFVGIEAWQADALLTLVDPFTRTWTACPFGSRRPRFN